MTQDKQNSAPEKFDLSTAGGIADGALGVISRVDLLKDFHTACLQGKPAEKSCALPSVTIEDNDSDSITHHNPRYDNEKDHIDGRKNTQLSEFFKKEPHDKSCLTDKIDLRPRTMPPFDNVRPQMSDGRGYLPERRQQTYHNARAQGESWWDQAIRK